ncbi:hypothetical protein M422DRAFT_266469 [Sphaerobolus stellatus SS14]|uniref:Unplaced genomic scaffold SPHSTscaffold_161, whole genome shotgun sequence n=1 Tax=Sphaerobolus stellatus (strain SS14) TaxID=990650 RepID=A0A0C9TP91_SPHS4|nr:hypothetical protein M422DRAFT_266469 [Sphaerobolus stellatus SS14]
MFLGGNDNTSAIDLSGLPVFQNGSKISASTPDLLHPDEITVTARLATVLVCQPQLWRFGGSVKIDLIDNSLSTFPRGEEEIGNISDEAVNILFSLALYQSIAQADPIAEGQSDGNGDRVRVNFAATKLFIGDPVDWSKANGTKPLDLDKIASNMNEFMTSAAKGLAQGYRAAGGDTSEAKYENKTVPAQWSIYQMQLVANRLPLFGGIALFALIVPLLVALQMSAIHHPDRMTFELTNILHVVEGLGINASDASLKDN